MRKIAVILVYLMFSAAAVQRLYCAGPGTTTASFLNIAIGARNIAMGETSDAVGDANAIYWNPAGLAYINSADANLMHAVWLQNITYDNLAVACPYKGGVFGLSVSYLSSGQIQEYDINDVMLPTTYQATDSAVSLAYARQIHDFAIGGTLKYIGSSLETDNASAYALDAGVMYEGIKHWRIRAGFQNVGTQMKFIDESDSLPQNCRVGCSYEAITKERMSLLCVLDVNFPIDNYIYENVGVEYVQKFNKIQVAGRVGYKSDTQGLDSIDGLTYGLGVSFEDYRLDYAFASYGDLGDTHRISLGWRFGNLWKNRKKAPKKIEENSSPGAAPAVKENAGKDNGLDEGDSDK